MHQMQLTKDILENYAKSHLADPERSGFQAAIATMQCKTHGALQNVVESQEIEQAGFGHLIADIQRRAYRLVPVRDMNSFHEMVYSSANPLATQ